jgi:hypothetical protein
VAIVRIQGHLEYSQLPEPLLPAIMRGLLGVLRIR